MLHRRSGKSHPSSSVFPPKPPLGDFDVVQLLRDVAHLDQHANWHVFTGADAHTNTYSCDPERLGRAGLNYKELSHSTDT